MTCHLKYLVYFYFSAWCIFSNWTFFFFVCIGFYKLQKPTGELMHQISPCSSSSGGASGALPPGGCVSTQPTLDTIDMKHWFISWLREQVVEPFLIIIFFLIITQQRRVWAERWAAIFNKRTNLSASFLHPNPTLLFKPRDDAEGASFFSFFQNTYLFKIFPLYCRSSDETRIWSKSSVSQHDLRRDNDGKLSRPVHVCSMHAPPANTLTWLSQSLKAEVRVKTVGFFTSLQLYEETKLVTPWTYHLLSGPRQFRGPPESPWERESSELQRRTWIRVLFEAASPTLHPETMSPPAQIMVVLTKEPHQLLRLHTACSTTGSRACCSRSGIGPWAGEMRVSCNATGWRFCIWVKETLSSAGGWITVEVPPAGDVARGPVSRNVSCLGEASDTNTVTHDGAFVQLQQSQIVPEEGDRNNSLISQSIIHPTNLEWPELSRK